MDWSNLISALIGGLLAVVPVMITIRNQATEREKDREEARREAKVRVREKWIERDIQVIMDSIEKTLQLLKREDGFANHMEQLVFARDSGIISQEEFQAEKKSLFYTLPLGYIELNQTSEKISSLVYSFDEVSILSSYIEFTASTARMMNKETEYIQSKIRGESIDMSSVNAEWSNLNRSAGRFQKALREKLISIRDS